MDHQTFMKYLYIFKNASIKIQILFNLQDWKTDFLTKLPEKITNIRILLKSY